MAGDSQDGEVADRCELSTLTYTTNSTTSTLPISQVRSVRTLAVITIEVQSREAETDQSRVAEEDQTTDLAIDRDLIEEPDDVDTAEAEAKVEAVLDLGDADPARVREADRAPVRAQSVRDRTNVRNRARVPSQDPSQERETIVVNEADPK